ncbi:MAG: hypothetical protein KDD73_09025 [Anaerolineales bacterium]|nr:hypothetical protein [Anaerolineales bacterium]
MNRQKLAKRYRSLWLGETTSSLLFIALFLNYALADGDWRNWIVRGYSLAVVLLILLQGIVWWRWKLRVLKADQPTIPPNILRGFAGFRTVNWSLIALFPLVVAAKWAVTHELWPSTDLLIGSLVMVGALLEQINYYHYQLMYDNAYDWDYLRRNRRLRQGNIGKALSQQRL